MKITKRAKSLIGLITISAGVLAGCSSNNSSSQESSKKEVVNVYSARHYDVDKELYKEFEKDTGIKVNVIEGKAPELLERLKRESKDTQADVFITSDIANLYQAVDSDLTQNIESEIVEKNIPQNLRGENNEWIGLTKRARIIAYDKEKVSPEELSTYEDLTSDKWKNEILVRSSESTYNQSLLASFIELNGEDKAKAWSEGIVNNFARDPQGNDRDQVKAIAAGEGKLAIVNSYYIGKMVNSEDVEEQKAVEKVGVFFPENAHVNVSGVVLSKYSNNKENAIKFVEYMTEENVQKQFADANSEYPANPNVEPSELLKSWGEFTAQDINLTNVGKYNKRAVEIFNEVNWK
ncbi:Fe(3+) ABC transporter substrate-binding protein [Romboutsia sp.]|uniref:Fe(3+) ABC transporter substrate-binding protein n=1 Tax=Romboutsia sp. TaxID=1965302 RepID=UPI002BB22B35|nr:Fe(3+) ABC transporter substrate-binding protein [Romboutsia sp.]HSQ89886.1 Fe(3+) ABC transporter substrate-binding protein [Romboutsia sp.]